MKVFDKDKALSKIKIKQNKNTYIKRLSISLSCLFLILVVMLFTFAKYESNSPDYTLIQGRVQSSSGDINIVSYNYDGQEHTEPPQKSQGYILTDLTCTNARGEWDDLNWELKISNLTNKVKCSLTFDNLSNYQIIELNPNGGYLAEQYIKGTIGQTLGTLPTPIKTGYTFDGWYKESSFTNKVQSTTVIDSSLTNLYAKYTDNTKTVSYSTNGTTIEDVSDYKSISITRSVGGTYTSYTDITNNYTKSSTNHTFTLEIGKTYLLLLYNASGNSLGYTRFDNATATGATITKIRNLLTSNSNGSGTFYSLVATSTSVTITTTYTSKAAIFLAE